MAGVPWKCFELEWNNYPRARFFKDRFLGLYPRFERVTAALPPCFDDTGLMNDLRWLKTELQKPPKVLILGLTDVTPKYLVISASAEQNGSDAKESTEDSKDVRNSSDDHEKTEDDADGTTGSMEYKHFEENIEQTLTYVIEKYSTLTQHNCVDVMVFRAPESWSKEELLKGQKLLNDHLCRMQKLHLCQSEQSDCQPLWNPTQTEMPSQISSKFEKRIVYQFVTMFGHLKSFMRTERRYDLKDNDVLRSHEIFKAVHNIVCNRYILAEIVNEIKSSLRKENTAVVLQDTSQASDHDLSINTSDDTRVQETDSAETNELIDTQNVGNEHDVQENTFEVDLIRKICNSITRAAVPLLAAKHNLVEACCHKLLIEIQFHDNLVSSIQSKNAKYYLLKIQQFAESVLDTNSERELSDKELSCLRQFKAIISEIQHDIEKTFVAIEKTLAKMDTVVTVMRKMAFEIKGYLTQSDVYRNFEDRMFQCKPFPQRIRENLLRIEGVFSVATVYGELEIELTRKPDEKTTNKVKSILNDGNYGFPHTIKLRERFLRPFAGGVIHFEQGDTLLSANPDKSGDKRIGTLGMCVKGSDCKSYGLTCAHVVEKSSSEVELLKSCETMPRLFGSVSEDMLVRRCERNISVLDIAAVSVFDTCKSQCCYQLLDDTATFKPFKIARFDNPDELIGKHVFKYGATTEFTEGIIKSSDFIFCRENVNHMFIVVESLPTLELRPDSGTYNYLDASCGSQEQLVSIRPNDTQAECVIKCAKEESLRDSLLDDYNQNTSGDEDPFSELDEQSDDVKSDKDMSDDVGTMREPEQVSGVGRSNEMYHDMSDEKGTPIELEKPIDHVESDKKDQYTPGDACAVRATEQHADDIESNKPDQTTSVAVCTVHEPVQQFGDDEAVNDTPRPELGEVDSAELRNRETTNNSTDNTATSQSPNKSIFADEGDSGAIVCMCDLTNDSLLVISMVSAGDTTSEDPFCLTIPMPDQMDALTRHIQSRKPNFQFQIPACD